MKLLQWIRACFAWELKHDTCIHHYFENRITGARRVVRVSSYGHQPVHWYWLAGGSWEHVRSELIWPQNFQSCVKKPDEHSEKSAIGKE